MTNLFEFASSSLKLLNVVVSGLTTTQKFVAVDIVF
jgi:hypothetical protein